MQKFLVFAGTTEGRRALELLAGPGRALWASAATEYGGESLPALAGLTVLTGRLEPDEMRALLELERFTCVLDATHPFARAATQNIRAACAAANTPYLRVLRESGAATDCVRVDDAPAAARYLAEHTSGGVLLTTGSKELEAFTAVPDYRERVFPRVLPVAESLEKCLSLGFPAKNIICMQGPFTAELNAALLRQTGAAWLVTKETGAAGGFPEKCEAARLAGASLLVIGRPEEPEGVTLSALPGLLEQRFGVARQATPPPRETGERPVPYFPLFVSLAGKTAVVLGAGPIAARRAGALAAFGCIVRVIAPKISQEMEYATQSGSITLLRRRYEPGDCAGAALVVAATDERAANAAAAQECAALGIPVSVADCKEESTFYFPGLVQSGGVTVGVTAGGTDHRLARRITENIRSQMHQLQAPDGEELP